MSEFDSLQRRTFLKGAAAVTLAAMSGVEELRAAEPASSEAPAGPPVHCGVIGLGPQGRDILGILSRLPLAQAVAICDTYEPFLNRSKELAPKATAHSDYKKLLEQKDVQAVFVATPSHQHKQIVLDALQAGKHVYCEAPLAVSVEEAREIAKAGKDSKQVFASGLQYRANPQHHHVQSFVKAGTLSTLAEARAQWHKKTSWRRTSPNEERQRATNWRLHKATSPGLMGEIGIHQVDIASWFLGNLPVSVTGFGGIMHWNDGRDVPDTVQCVIEYPKNVRFAYDATLVNSFGGMYELFMGADGAVLTQDLRAWMMKETDSPLLGWEVYAKKEKVMDDTGIVLIANATKILSAGGTPSIAQVDTGKTPLYYSVEHFATCIKENKKPDNGPEVGYQATVVALKANEAVTNGAKVTFQKEWFDL
ncbi:MAG: Gfo/Idh/MocA family oxidoreductase [Armatimonadetes bacterium]|nr:Gfo/Idh/MocA family oxidoreductase [Armatimonadota bacterium]